MAEPILSYSDSTMPPVKRGLIRLVEAATGRRRLTRLYQAQQRSSVGGESFFGAAVRSLALDVRYDPDALDRVPRTGPLVIVANHPYGVLDGIVVSWLTQKVRPDFRVLTHSVLLRAPEVQPYLLPVDFTGTEEARRTNLLSRAGARRHLEAGGCVVVFPAGGISTAPDRLGSKRAVDGPWQPFTAQLVQRSGATVVPFCFEGQNSRLFQIASHLSPALRLSLIFHEVSSRIGTMLRVAIGEPVEAAAMAAASRQGLTDELRARTEALASQFASAPRPGKPRRLPKPFSAWHQTARRARSAAQAATRQVLRQPRPR